MDKLKVKLYKNYIRNFLQMKLAHKLTLITQKLIQTFLLFHFCYKCLRKVSQNMSLVQ